ncbi:MAG: hypothetical protein M0R06_01750, partial [Sphaerochaeta sp.]|nr:hypothetical protein [Sphaerochaeta sp.]
MICSESGILCRNVGMWLFSLFSLVEPQDNIPLSNISSAPASLCHQSISFRSARIAFQWGKYPRVPFLHLTRTQVNNIFSSFYLQTSPYSDGTCQDIKGNTAL